MPSVPSRLTDLTHPDAVKVINQLFDTYSKRIDTVAQQAASKRISSVSKLNFGTIPASSCKDSVVNILGASTTLVAHANPVLPLSVTPLTWSSFVSKNGQVTVRVSNPTTAPVVVNTVTWNILVA
jgi:hypothetical protein